MNKRKKLLYETTYFAAHYPKIYEALWDRLHKTRAKMLGMIYAWEPESRYQGTWFRVRVQMPDGSFQRWWWTAWAEGSGGRWKWDGKKGKYAMKLVVPQE